MFIIFFTSLLTIATESIVNFADQNPTLLVKTELKRGPTNHPFIRGYYHNGNNKTICIKNIQPSEIHKYVLFLRNQVGRRVSYMHIITLYFIFYMYTFISYTNSHIILHMCASSIKPYIHPLYVIHIYILRTISFIYMTHTNHPSHTLYILYTDEHYGL